MGSCHQQPVLAAGSVASSQLVCVCICVWIHIIIYIMVQYKACNLAFVYLRVRDLRGGYRRRVGMEV